MRIPMPSPRGSNHERLYITGAAGAYDEALSDDKRGKLKAFLGDKLAPADMEAMEAILDAEEADPDEPASEGAQDRAYVRKVWDRHRRGEIGYDEATRRVQAGRPRAVNEASFYERYPEAKLIKLG